MGSLMKKQAERFLREKKRHRRWLAVFLCLSLLVTSGTFAALRMNGHAMDYTDKALNCQLQIHEHTEECFDDQGELTCGKADCVIHTHDAQCYENGDLENGKLVCQLPEKEAHVHDSACYEEKQILTCKEEETAGHQHTPECYIEERGELICSLPEHEHSEACYNEVGELTCGQDAHMHDSSCYEVKEVLNCGQEEGSGHTHSDSCYETEKTLTCDKEELKLHTHNDTCYDENGALICGQLELKEHQHGPECFEEKKEEDQTKNEENGSVEPEDSEAPESQDEETDGGPNEVVSDGNVSDDTLSENAVSGNDLSVNSVFDGKTGDGSSPVRKKLKGSGRNTPSGNTMSENVLSGNTASGNGLAYVSSFEIVDKMDGSAPFDGDNEAGNDKDASNGIVRTFDTVNYSFKVTTASRDEKTLLSKACIDLKFKLPASKKQAEFDLDAMSWLEEPKVEEKTDEEGSAYQVLTGKKRLSKRNEYVVPGTYESNVIIKIKDMKQGATLKPLFSAAMEENAENEWKEAEPSRVTVSAAPKYNIALKSGYSYKGTFDFNSGENTAANHGKGPFIGRAVKLGVAIQLYNDNESKGLKGIELPNPDEKITFDLDIGSEYSATEPVEGYEKDRRYDITDKGFRPLLWSFDGSADFGYGGKDQNDRALNDSDWSKRLVPYNELKELEDPDADPEKVRENRERSCYNGGNWQAVQEGNKITVTVSGWEINPDQMPTKNGDGSDAQYTKNIGCFSAGEFVLIQPYNTQGSSSTEPDFDIVKKIGVGTFHPSAAVSNLKVGNTVYDPQSPEEKRIEQSFIVTTLGEMTNNVGYLKSGEDWRWASPGFEDGHFGHGDAYTLAGEELNLAGGFSYNAGNQGRMSWGSNLMKFEGEKLELMSGLENISSCFENDALLDGNGMILEGPKQNTFVFYATKENGETWTDFEEMRDTYEDKLIFYKSLSDIPEGHVCVGILTCFKGIGADARGGMNAPIYQVAYRAKAKKEFIGETCALLSTSRVWPENVLRDAGITLHNIEFQYQMLNGKQVLKGLYGFKRVDAEWGWQPDGVWYEGAEWGIIKPMETWYEGGLNVKLPAEFYRNANIVGYIGWKGENTRYDDEGNIVKYGSLGEGIGSDYQKTVYENYTMKTHNSADMHWGDTLLILGYKAQITKSLLQKDSTGQTKTTFLLNKDQRVVDYKLEPKIIRRGEETAKEEKTDVTIVDTLPQHMRYVEGSAKQSGKYTQTSPEGGERGEVEGGEILEPDKIVVNEDGTQTLTWTLPDVVIGEEIEPIYYSVLLGDLDDPKNDIQETMRLKNTVYIFAEGDKREPSLENGKLAEVEITAQRDIETSFGKTVKQDIVEEDGEIDYTIYYNNFTLSEKKDALVVDTMPADGINGSKFGGTYKVLECKLDERSQTNKTIKIYYTMNYTGNPVTTDEIRSADSGWTEATISNGSIDLTSLQEPPAGWAIVADVESGRSVRVNLKIKLDPSEGRTLDEEKNRFVNAVTDGTENAIKVSTKTARRVLEGLAWMDYDHDGLQDEDPTADLSGVKVALLKLKENSDAPDDISSYEPVCYPDTKTPIEIQTGQMVSVRDSTTVQNFEAYNKGQYRFTDLEPGTYAVQFTDGSTKISQLKPTLYKAEGVPEDRNSDGQPIYEGDGENKKFTGTFIPNIKMPELEDIPGSGIYISEHNDSGFYPENKIQIVKKGKGAASEITLAGAEFTLSKYTDNENGAGQEGEELYRGISIKEDKSDGVVQWKGGDQILPAIPAGTYLMREVKAPENYLLSTEEWIIKIDADGFPTVKTKNGDSVKFKQDTIKDESGNPITVVYTYTFYDTLHYELPSTGGAGIYWYTIGGMLLMLAAALILYKNKRKEVLGG